LEPVAVPENTAQNDELPQGLSDAAISGAFGACTLALSGPLTPAGAAAVCGVMAKVLKEIQRLIKAVAVIKDVPNQGKLVAATASAFADNLMKVRPDGKGLVRRALRDIAVPRGKASKGGATAVLIRVAGERAGLHPFLVHTAREAWYKAMKNEPREKREAELAELARPSWEGALSSIKALSANIKGSGFSGSFDTGWNLANDRLAAGGSEAASYLTSWLGTGGVGWQDWPVVNGTKMPPPVKRYLAGTDELVSGAARFYGGPNKPGGVGPLADTVYTVFAKAKANKLSVGVGSASPSQVQADGAFARQLGAVAALGWTQALVRDLNAGKGWQTVPAKNEGDDGEDVAEYDDAAAIVKEEAAEAQRPALVAGLLAVAYVGFA
jgi:hypothetical protein